MKLSRLLLVLTLTLLSNFALANTEDCHTNPALKKLQEVYELIKKDYVRKVDDSSLTEAAISGMLTSLDPHSSFLNKDMVAELNSYSQGEFGGIGAELVAENGLIKVIAPLDDSPAALAGIRAGDYIVGVDGQSVYGMNANDEIKKIRGPAGTVVRLSIIRDRTHKPIDIDIKREIIKIMSVKSRLESDDVAYIRISTFSENTSKNVIKELKKIIANNKNLKGIVLDLRNNPGGLLDQAVAVSDIFLPSGDIVYTKGRNEAQNTHYKASKSSYKVLNLPIVVLINEGSASAAEIVAGALQDYKRAVIFGTRSFGKGSVQTVIPLSDGVALGLTTALYYTPKGRIIQAVGIEPDVIVERSVIKEIGDQNANFREEDLLGHINQSDKDTTTKENSILNKLKNKGNVVKQVEEDYQLERAIDLIKGIGVYNDIKKHE